MLKDDIEMIEQAAKEADEFLSGKIIDNVCFQIPFEHMDLPCGRRQFYYKRKLFFVKLYRFMNERKENGQSAEKGSHR